MEGGEGDFFSVSKREFPVALLSSVWSIVEKMFAGGRDSSVPIQCRIVHFGTGAKLSGHFGTSLMVPKWGVV